MKKIGLIILIAIAIGIGVMAVQPVFQQPQLCTGSSRLRSTAMRTNLVEQGFGAIQKYRLPGGRFPNAITVAEDKSIWFGEQGLPGVGHLYTNGTLVEYRWPFQYSAQSSFTFIWGIAIWKDCVWASDQQGSQIVALDPNTGAVRVVTLQEGSFPYTVSVGPDDSLWFTEAFASRIGRIDERLQLHEYPVSFVGIPGQIVFVNNTVGYYVDTGNVGLARPGIFSFNPQNFAPTEVGSEATLQSPTSLAVSESGLWVAEHGTSILGFYDLNLHQWSFFPTSPVSYRETTLPYFVAANDSVVWFNEHYGNRIARIDEKRTLTEYSVSNPPANRINDIDNVLTFAVSGNKVWFTELTAGYVGFLDASLEPDFTISQPSIANIELKPGENASVALTVSGHSTSPLTVQFADSENVTGRPSRIDMTTNVTEIKSLTGEEEFTTNLRLDRLLPAGHYVLLVAVTDGLVSRGVYLELNVAA